MDFSLINCFDPWGSQINGAAAPDLGELPSIELPVNNWDSASAEQAVANIRDMQLKGLCEQLNY
jgi:hypothetical protein